MSMRVPCFIRPVLLILALGASAWPENAFQEEWQGAGSGWFYLSARGGSLVASNTAIASAHDGKALELRIPAGAGASPSHAAEVESKDSLRYGTFSARLKTADCSGQADAGVVTGLFTYFNDGTDLNGDGLPDNSEIDFEWLCAEPQTVYLTMWTDYRDSDGRHKRVTRLVDLATGAIGYTLYKQTFSEPGVTLTGAENDPASLPVLSGYNSSAAFYEYGFSWSASRVTWWVVNSKDGTKIVLWDYQGPVSRIPARPSQFMVNVWHTSDWTPDDRPSAVAAPTGPVAGFVDWAAYDPMTSASALPSLLGSAAGLHWPSASAHDALGRSLRTALRRSFETRFAIFGPNP